MNEHIQCPENSAVLDGQQVCASKPDGWADAALIGARLRRYRNAQGRTLQVVADFLDTTPQSISRLEKGMMTLSVDWMLRICSVLGVDPAVIVRGDESNEIRVMGTLDDNHKVQHFPPNRHEIVSIETGRTNLIAIRSQTKLSMFENGDILIAHPTELLPPGNRDYGLSFVSVDDEPPVLRQVFQSANGQWITVGVDCSAQAQFTADLTWLAPVVTLVRHMPGIREAPGAEQASALHDAASTVTTSSFADRV